MLIFTFYQITKDKIRVIGDLFFENDEWFLISNNNITYSLLIKNGSNVNESEFQELLGSKVIIWGDKISDNKILVDFIREFTGGFI